MIARTQMERLDKCIKGKKILDNESQIVSEILMSGFVPRKWIKNCGQKRLQGNGNNQGVDTCSTITIDNYLNLSHRRVAFCEVYVSFCLGLGIYMYVCMYIYIYINSYC